MQHLKIKMTKMKEFGGKKTEDESFSLRFTSSMSCCPFGSLLIRVWMTWNTGLGSTVSGAALKNKPRYHSWQRGNQNPSNTCWSFSPRLWWKIAPQPVHDQGAEDHGQVGATHPHLAAEEKCRQLPGLPTVTQRQAGALLEGGAEEREGGADWRITCSLLLSSSSSAGQHATDLQCSSGYKFHICLMETSTNPPSIVFIMSVFTLI